MQERTIDARGLQCPGPVIEAKNALKNMTGGVLTVLVDNAIAVENLKKLSNYMELPVVSEKREEKLYVVSMIVGKGERQMEVVCHTDNRGKGKVVVLSADHMGEGDEVLGKILMKGFIYALTNLAELPETILLYNSGAKLSVEGSDSLEDLKILEAEGVEILTCGACLQHYGLTDKLSVGVVTNMYEIAEKMAGAILLIRP